MEERKQHERHQQVEVVTKYYEHHSTPPQEQGYKEKLLHTKNNG